MGHRACQNSQPSSFFLLPSFFVPFASSRFNNTNSSDQKGAIIKKADPLVAEPPSQRMKNQNLTHSALY
jgi:hypothetical protein